MTPAQILILRNAIRTELDPVLVALRTARDSTGIQNWLNETGTATVWKSSVTKNEVGKTFQATALAAITAGNNEKLANFAAWNEVIDPSRADQRQFFNDIFSVAAGATTRAALDLLWRRTATRGERIFATGTGTDALPATLGYEGQLSEFDVRSACWSDTGGWLA